MPDHSTILHVRWTITAGLVLLAAAAVAVAPKLGSATRSMPGRTEVADVAQSDLCLRVGKLECCVAEEAPRRGRSSEAGPAAGSTAEEHGESGEMLEALGYVE